ncbi:hypothetical protein [Streptomyces indicus]|uniref:hypothetical protein n=1 Tax=Streptomyces indicus TaxID=417292 RepID=UPI00115F970A|nr:hypothetical protein [Streptomyces indicus]
MALIAFGVMLPIGVLIGANIGHAADRVYALLAAALPGPVHRASPRSLRLSGWVLALLALVGLLLEVRTGLS